MDSAALESSLTDQHNWLDKNCLGQWQLVTLLNLRNSEQVYSGSFKQPEMDIYLLEPWEKRTTKNNNCLLD